MLILGPMAFEAFETPARLAFGGKQRIATHKLSDGTRVLDALGRDDAALKWSGVFSGPDASARARVLDLLRAEGSVWPLSWDAFCYLVVIEDFEASYERSNWVPYKISCVVLEDQSASLFEVLADPALAAALVVSDLVAARGFGFDPTMAPNAMAASADAILATPMPLDLVTALAATGGMAAAAAGRGYAQRAAGNLKNLEG